MNMWTEDLVLPEELRKERLQKEPAATQPGFWENPEKHRKRREKQ